MSRPQQTLIDYVVIAVNPVLVMLLVCSLAYFLLDVFYQGQYSGRVHFVTAMFVMAAVLVTRIAIEMGTEQAYLYAGPLGAVTLLALWKFVAFEGVLAPFSLLLNAVVLGVVWFAAHKLTWDSTVVDESQDASGEGLLETIGLDERTTAGPQAHPTPAEPPEGVTTGRRHYTLWERLRYNEQRLHRPGLWVVYFSMAALPLFGIGQLLSPARDAAQHFGRFQLALVYIAAGLALLLTTSFLNLRRYLRKRHLVMSPAIAATWLALGAVILAGVLVAATLLPRPNAEYAFARMSFRLTSPQRTSARMAPPGEAADIQRDGPRSGTREQPQTPHPAESEQSGPSDQSGSARPEDSENSGRQPQSGQSAQGRQAQSGGSRQPAQSPESSAESQQQSESQEPSGGSTGGSSRSGGSSQRPSGSSSGGSSRSQSGAQQQRGENRPESPSQTQTTGQSSPRSAVEQLVSPLGSAGWLAVLLKALLWLALAIVAGIVLWRNRQQIADGVGRLLAGLADWWGWLLRRPRKTAEPGAAAAQAARPRPRPFSAYADPFLTGQAEQWPPGEVVRYTFDALEAWARDRSVPRQPQQTPHEFVEQLARQVPDLEEPARQLTNLYYQQAYGPGPISRGPVARLRQLWELLTRLPPTEPVAASTLDRPEV